MIQKNKFKGICRIVFLPVSFPMYYMRYINQYPNDSVKQAWGAFTYTINRELDRGLTLDDIKLEHSKQTLKAIKRQKKIREEMNLATTAEFVEIN